MFKTKIVSLLLVLVLLTSSLTSCAPAQTKTVGKVGGYEVAYDELYFLAYSYKGSLEAKYGKYDTLSGERARLFENELSELVYSNIVTNYAILSLCEAEGLTLKSDGLDKRVDKYIENLITTEFASIKSEYKESLARYGMTDRYVRFTVSVDMLYSDLKSKLLEKSDVTKNDAKMKEVIKDEFVRTWHVAVINDSGDNIESNRAKVEAALKKYKDGTMSMYDLIGSAYNEDLSLTELDGFYFTRGSMDEAYEKAAFELKVGEVSGVVETKGAFYIIQRLEIENAYVNENLDELKEKYIDSVVYEMLEQKKTELKFEPNEFSAGLNIASLEAPAEDGLMIALYVGVGALAVAGIVVAVILIRKRKTKALAVKKK